MTSRDDRPARPGNTEATEPKVLGCPNAVSGEPVRATSAADNPTGLVGNDHQVAVLLTVLSTSSGSRRRVYLTLQAAIAAAERARDAGDQPRLSLCTLNEVRQIRWSR